jgi:hypothetical protein
MFIHGLALDYITALIRLKSVNDITVMNYANGYFTTVKQAKDNYLASQELTQLAEDEVSFTHAAKETGYEESQPFDEVGKHYEGYDKDLYPYGQDFLEFAGNPITTTTGGEFSKEELIKDKNRVDNMFEYTEKELEELVPINGKQLSEDDKPGIDGDTFTITMNKDMLTFPSSWMRQREEEE